MVFLNDIVTRLLVSVLSLNNSIDSGQWAVDSGEWIVNSKQ
jgi:hypothetical protein